MENLKTAFRDTRNATRSYVTVNSLLGKHLPVSPEGALTYFARLGEKTAETCRGEKVLVIGFAETATAVGAAVAAMIENAVYVHTTREILPADKLVSEFLEEHSHAKNQALYFNENDLSKFERIIFVEDEITTGKTILNFLKSVDYCGKITLSALVFNGFDKSAFSEQLANISPKFVCLQETGYVKYLKPSSLPNPRLGTDAAGYADECQRLSLQIINQINEFCSEDIPGKNILVIGTEEFMFPALILGRELEKSAKSVKSHSTTRSKLLPLNQSDYPLHTRTAFASVYDDTRNTYLYNVQKYDTVIIVTDSREFTKPGTAEPMQSLLQSIQNAGNQNIYFARIDNA